MKPTANAKHRIFQALFATVILVTAVFAVPSTNAKYSTKKKYNIVINSIVNSIPVYKRDETKIIDFTKVNLTKVTGNQYSTTTPAIRANANTTNSDSGKVYYFSSHDKTNNNSNDNAERYTIDGKTLDGNSYQERWLDNMTRWMVLYTQNVNSRVWTGAKIVNYMTGTLNAANLTPVIDADSTSDPSPYSSRDEGRYNPNQTLTITVTESLKEGWYYTQVPFYVSSNYRNVMYEYSLFYLPAAQETDMNPEQIAVYVPEGQSKQITFTFQTVTGTNNSYIQLTRISFPQAIYQ